MVEKVNEDEQRASGTPSWSKTENDVRVKAVEFVIYFHVVTLERIVLFVAGSRCSKEYPQSR